MTDMNMRFEIYRGERWRSHAAILLACVMSFACQTTVVEPPKEQAVDAADQARMESEQAAAKAPPSREVRALASQQAFDAMDMLQRGDEAAAKRLLEHVLQIAPGNEMGRKLMDQIVADPLKELGSVYFRYTVKPDDSLSKLALRFLDDRYRFYILARYNGLQVPNDLEVGQVIKIPGVEPPPEPEPAPPAETPSETPAAVPTPVPEPVAQPRLGTPAQTIRRLTREAEICYQRDRDLDCAIAKWDQVLRLDPDNQLIRLKREKAAALREKLRQDGK
jgi:hypothetical protein